MADTYTYPAKIERDEDGRYVVTFPDFGWGATDGATRDEALAEARDLLRELIATTMREGADLPEPSRIGKRRPLVVPPVQIAMKMRPCTKPGARPAFPNAVLARELELAEGEIRRMLNPEHRTKSATIESALGATREPASSVIWCTTQPELIHATVRSAPLLGETQSSPVIPLLYSHLTQALFYPEGDQIQKSQASPRSGFITDVANISLP